MKYSRNIHKETITGIIGGENNFIETRQTWEDTLTKTMRDTGYVPVLDLEPKFTSDYDAEKDWFSCTLVMYFIYIGKKKAWLVQGISNNKEIPLYTPQPKSEKSSVTQASV